MPRGPALDAEAILTATEDVLRRYGLPKSTVVEVAKTLGVSHASVYRHFPSKVALHEAVTRRWLSRSHQELADVAADTAVDPSQRLASWLTALFAAKREKYLDDPALFATYGLLVSEHSVVATEHITELLGQLTRIIGDGVRSGDFASADPEIEARAVFDATTAFHHPAHADQWGRAETRTAFENVRILVLNSIRSH
ncbi:TetR family transcriptional regulator [Amycolatopsis sp. H20-H5]|uniref:TetR family transcriptional regulator n=1 Tax=Amycolatopsis sp. H20-H5 TaxID=3046309 RepID=UPI002DB88704|nr:TetR family transcriptional regulator [Amycolatopsis sp. H20-H5]MEC3980070.1 TetR family transcriptional regulator [Amycolatopsis sp. H20-H5]